jgi:hypothetical protein
MKRKRLFIWIGTTVVLVAAVIMGLVVYSLHSFARTPIVTKLQMDDIETAVKGVAGELMFGEVNPTSVQTLEGKGLDALFAAQKQPPQGAGLIADYQRNPERFRHYAQLFDAAVTAMHIANAVQVDQSAYVLPMSSSDLPLQSSEKLDSWSHPYCVSSFKNALVVVSGGPQASTFSCAVQHLTKQQLANATRKVFQTAQGEVVLVLKPADKTQ